MMLVPRPSVREVLAQVADVAGGGVAGAAEVGAAAVLSPETEVRAREALARLAEQQAPWYLRLLIGIGAWTGGAFLLSFVLGILMMVVGRNSYVAAGVIGALLMVAATALRRQASGLFARQIALVACLAGLMMLIGSVGGATSRVTPASLAALGASAALLVLFPDAILRFCSVLVATGALVALMVDWKIPFGADALAALFAVVVFWLWHLAPRDVMEDAAEIVEPIVYGLVVGLFGVLLAAPLIAMAVAGVEPQRLTWSAEGLLGLPVTAVFGLAAIWLAASIFEEHGVNWSRPEAALTFGAIVLLAGLTYTTPEILASILILLLGFERRARALVALAALFFIGFATSYYYDLQLTLLQKSGVLILSGAVCLAAWAFVQARFAREAV